MTRCPGKIGYGFTRMSYFLDFLPSNLRLICPAGLFSRHRKHLRSFIAFSDQVCGLKRIPGSNYLIIFLILGLVLRTLVTETVVDILEILSDIHSYIIVL